MKTFIAAFIGFLALLSLVNYLAHDAVEGVFEDEYDLFRSVQIGMSEQDVIDLLGKPHRVYRAPDAPADYYVNGYARKQRPIKNKVFIYIGSEPIAYIYFDQQNEVEDVFVGGS